MADKAISELVAAEQIKSTDMFVLEQDGTAKRLQGQTLLNWLTAAADGHGGISNIAKTGTDGLVDTYTITLADTTTKTFTVTNGNGLTAFEKLSTVGLVDNYRFTRTDGTFFDFSVSNGAKGDTGEASHVWIKYASQQPTASSHSMGDLPDAWMGVYSGTAAEAPDDWQQYTWYQIKGEKGDTGAAATVTGTTVEYMVSDSGTIVPSGSWSTTIPTVPQGKYLWTRVKTTFNTGSPAVSYSVTRMGIDGAGSVSSVNEKSPDESGNVSLSAEDIPTSGGRSVQAVLDDKQEALTAGENISISGSVIATKAFPCNPNLLDNWYFGNPVNQRGASGTISTEGYFFDRWKLVSGSVTINSGGIVLNGTIAQVLEHAAGQTVTATVLTPDGVTDVTPVYDDETKTFTVTTQGKTIRAVKLELGTQQTLAHQENGAWGLNEIPDYGEQLRRCQRYCRVYKSGEILPCLAYGQNEGWYASAALPFDLRAIPANNLSSGFAVVLNGIDVGDDIMASMENWGTLNGVQRLRITSTGQVFNVSDQYTIKLSNDLILSADL
jgi:hypothetical protein|nr:MAG TPA: tail protein [Caudoviricetes sp.]